MHIDHSLTTEAQFLAGGNIHKVENYIAAYKSTYAFALENQDEKSINLFEEAEKRLISFVAKKRKQRYQENKDTQKDLENIKRVCK